MASWAIALALAMLFPAAVLAGDDRSPPDCTAQVSELEPCLEFVKGEERSPSADCCSGLQQIHATKPECLCLLVSSSLGIAAVVPGINATLAQQVPGICNVHVNPSRCSALLSGSSGTASSPNSGASAEGFMGSSSSVGESSSKAFFVFAFSTPFSVLFFFLA
ncbi:hypothetical protein SELMODRAFT_411802 [Selaginella moellendorffii]|uniref:Bifunctional inhibitor/plant lipid transfer protein/seed storage helical domain-containing protein n=1 Tax=Selaginella moellendorffii TaxID=88036 RepID=D8RJ31_SELML|nr:protein YLS3 [Selaginella moellendorffii]EFJ27845.1 hypothetical protein SELMODRAFT_411802 [Selaginella moellendorffii]|eukprot:XP_002971247.1 protein YLS3 [Selaginella moellendorffii]